MSLFGKLIDQLDEYVVNQPENVAAIAAIRAGNNIDPKFWDEFLILCNQANVLSELLGVRKDIIAKWPAAIRQGVATVKQMDSHEAATRKSTMLTTGF